MTAYAIFLKERTIDAERLDLYTKMGAPTVERSTGRPLAFFGPHEVVEGASIEGIALLEFPSMEDAKAWYNSTEYQEALPHRQAAAQFKVMFVEGIPPA